MFDGGDNNTAAALEADLIGIAFAVYFALCVYLYITRVSFIDATETGAIGWRRELKSFVV